MRVLLVVLVGACSANGGGDDAVDAGPAHWEGPCDELVDEFTLCITQEWCGPLLDGPGGESPFCQCAPFALDWETCECTEELFLDTFCHPGERLDFTCATAVEYAQATLVDCPE